MNYEDLIADVAQRTGLHSDYVRRVLFHLPDALMTMQVGDDVRTPMGVFRMAESKARTIVLPDQTTTAQVPAKTVVKLRSGSRMKNEEC